MLSLCRRFSQRPVRLGLWGRTLVVAGVLLSACSVSTAAPDQLAEPASTWAPNSLVGEEVTTSTTADDQTESSTNESASTQALPDASAALQREEPDDARALITPNGIVLPVLGWTTEGYEVMTPCGEEGFVTWGTPLFTAEVVLDPGHGGQIETGAQGPNGLAEKDLNLRIVKRAANELRQRGITVVLTRTADYRVPLSVRAAIANQLEAELLVSVHHNAPVVGASDGPGTEVFVQSDSEESRRLGGIIYEEVVAALEQFDDVSWVAASDAGALAVLNRDGEDAYGMIRRPDMPAVLLEYGYLASFSEAELFATDEYVEVAAIALVDAIERWLDSDDPGSGFVDEPRRFTPDGSTGHSRGCVDPPLE